jgi:polysaccharide deacetylase family protein (PEP-CTERM system associated)
MINALTVDVEEYFHPSEVQRHVSRSDWPFLQSRVEVQVDRILNLFDNHRVSATFFVLGWVAERQPALVRRIAARGHDIGCHSYAHELVYGMTAVEFQEDTRRAVAAIEDACGIRPVAYRAPSYSITSKCLWALDILVENGFVYDSSIYPIKHDRYGIPGFNRHATVLQTPSGPIQEIPIGTVKLGGDTVAPIGGGGYLRMLPYRYTAAGIRRVNEEENQPVCVYFHPWEIDPSQPALASGVVSWLRTYTGIRGMYSKIDKLLYDFAFGSLPDVYPAPMMPVSSIVHADSIGVPS